MKLELGSRLKAWARGSMRGGDSAPNPPQRFTAPDVLGVPQAEKIAMDDAMSSVYEYASLNHMGFESFMGYPALAQLTQIAEYRMLSEKTAEAMTRKWIKLRSKGDTDKTERMQEIEDELTRLQVRDLFCECAKLDGFFGRAQLFVDMGEQSGSGLMLPLVVADATMRGKLRKFKVVEPMFTYPNDYDAGNPLSDTYYAPRSWFVTGQKVHSSRLLTFVGRPVPDILKPAYNFGGLSMSQLARPYVENWLKTRQSVNRLISNYSTSGVKTNLGDALSGGSGEDVLERVQLYTDMRDNQGTMLLDKETEDFFQFNVPLSGLDKLQAQAQEHLASVSSMPLPVLTGVTPAGLNASAEGDIEIWYEHIGSRQNQFFRPNLTRIIEMVQVSKFGEVDPDIVFDFVPLKDQDEGELATNRKSDAEAASIYVEMGAVSPEEVRRRLAADEHSGYNAIDVNVMPERPEDEEEDDETPSTDE